MGNTIILLTDELKRVREALDEVTAAIYAVVKEHDHRLFERFEDLIAQERKLKQIASQALLDIAENEPDYELN